jgi:hypothetical protein
MNNSLISNLPDSVQEVNLNSNQMVALTTTFEITPNFKLL